LGTIRLLDIVLRGHHGVSPAEREAGQKLEVDVELEADLEAAAREDSLESAIDYREIYGVIERTVTERSFRLLEALANQVAADLLNAFPAKKVRVRIRKANVGVSGNLGCFVVELERDHK
jgi:dihydroneopterin aldolase